MFQPTTKSQAFERFFRLPEKFRAGKVGVAIAAIIDHLDAVGHAPLRSVLTSLYPDIEQNLARQKLQTQVINRQFVRTDGTQPLLLKMSRKSRSGGVDHADQSLWFECEEAVDYANLTPANPRYDEYEFVGGQAMQATAKELLQAQDKPALVMDAFTESAQAVVLSDSYKAKLNQGRAHALHGVDTAIDEPISIRRQIADEKFVKSQAHETIAMQTEHDLVTGRSVTCINAMLEWACTPVDVGVSKPSRFNTDAVEQPYTKPLLALLGDYGTGKTSHAQQLNRILNGLSTTTDKPNGSPTAVMVDLALLAGAERLSELSLTELLVLALKKQRAQGFSTDDALALIQRVKQGEMVLIYDGFDELIKTTREKLHSVLQQLLVVLQPTTSSTSREPIPSKAKILLSCRTHYFRDAHEQLAFFDTRARGNAKRGDYLCLTLMAWSTENIKTYLSKHLNKMDTERLLAIIQDTYNLKELASRPVLLAMMSEQLGQLLRQHEKGETIDAAKLYGISVAEWVQRDTGKHVIQATHKPLVMGALASAMTKDGTETWEAEKLDRWIVTVLPTLYPNTYELPQKSKEIQDDLRTATFIVRPVQNQFNFAHKSFKEYFTARFVWDCLTLIDQGAITPEAARGLLVSQPLNTETMAFLKEWWQAQASRSPEQAVRNTAVLIGLLQNPKVSFVAFYLDENGNTVNRSKVKESEQNGYYQAPELHQVLFEIGLSLGLFEKSTIEKVRAFASSSGRGFQSTIASQAPIYAQLDTHINLRGLEFKRNRWRALDFSDLPLDLRDANLLQLRTYHCEFGNTLCARANWAQTVMRDSTIKDMDWGEGAFAADRGGQMIRYGEMKQPTKPLKGPWSKGLIFKRNDKFPTEFLTPHGGNLIMQTEEALFAIWQIENARFINMTDKTSIDQELHRHIDTALASKEERLFDRDFQSYDFSSVLLDDELKQISLLIDQKTRREYRCFTHWDPNGNASFDSQGNLLSYDDEAADSWLFCLASGKPEPVEFGVPVED